MAASSSAQSSYPFRDTNDHEFDSMLRQCTLQAVCKRWFVRVRKLKDWLRTSCANGRSNFHRILSLTSDFKFWHQNMLRQGGESMDLVFCILMLSIGTGYEVYLCRFKAIGIQDHSLPIPHGTLREKLNKVANLDPAERDALATAFFEMQWAFCAPVFGYGSKDHDEFCIAPIIERKSLGQKSGTAELYRIVVLEEFLSDELKAHKSLSCFTSLADELGERYELVSKSFYQRDKRHFLDEVKMFHTLDSCIDVDDFVRYLSDYSLTKLTDASAQDSGVPLSDDMTTLRYHIILELGDFDLDMYFERESPPAVQTEIQHFWEDLLQIVDALASLHNLKPKIGKAAIGVHADIKPANILSVQGRFKLADLGYARSGAKASDYRLPIDGGTRVFGPPELHNDSPQCSRSNDAIQSIDIWSLGCVLSMAATWVVLGFDGLQKYKMVRRAAVNKEIQKDGCSLDGPGLYFHNGYATLEEIPQWHQYLRAVMRKADNITGAILDLVDNYMLLSEPGSRITAKNLNDKYKEVLKESRSPQNEDLGGGINPWILAILATEGDESQLIDKSSPIPAASRQLLTVREGDRYADAIQDLKLQNQRRGYLIPALAPNTLSSRSNVIEINTVPRAPLAMNNLQQTQRLSVYTGTPSIASLDMLLRPIASEPETPWEVTPNRRLASARAMDEPENAFQARGNRRRAPRSSPDPVLLENFKHRDLHFLVDNAQNMVEWYDELAFVTEELLYKCSGIDDDGIDLKFTCSRWQAIKGEKRVAILQQAIEKETNRPKLGRTDMKGVFQSIFGAFQEKWALYDEKHAKWNAHSTLLKFISWEPSEPKDATYIILTNGLWSGSKHAEVEQVVREFCTWLGDRFSDEARKRFSIAFVQFGKDEQADRCLQYLDDGMKELSLPDVIDLTPARDGDIYKMLLGSFNQKYDDLDEAPLDESIPSTPSQYRAELSSPGAQTPPANPLRLTPSASRRVSVNIHNQHPHRNSSQELHLPSRFGAAITPYVSVFDDQDEEIVQSPARRTATATDQRAQRNRRQQSGSELGYPSSQL